MAELATAVLFSAGLDSAVLVADELRRGRVHPLYVSVGLAWETAEVATAQRLVSTPVYLGRVGTLEQLRFTMQDVYPPTHWAVRGVPPAYDTPDEDVYLTGRNLVLLAKAGTWCAEHRVPRIVLGPLSGNPFPDARPEFFAAMAAALSLGLDWQVEIAAPYRDLHKEQVIQRGVELGVPFELTLSCMSPRERASGASGASGSWGSSGSSAPFLHCGACSKCRERQQAFAAAGVTDPTSYVVSRHNHEGTTARRLEEQ
jgi:7-cyano-7-deazaguanine synthase